MKVLIFGSSGFVGSNIAKKLELSGHEVTRTAREPSSAQVYADLLMPKSVEDVLLSAKPDVVIQAAGVVENSGAADVNPIMTKNLLDKIIALRLSPKVIVIGSAAEYGPIAKKDLPVSEDAPLNANTQYGLSKKHETELALKYTTEHNLNIIVVRIFNPIGVGMHQRFLLSALIRQVKAIKAGEKKEIEISRLDSKRDYIDVKDMASAVQKLVEGNPKYNVYNIGSGKSTSNKEIIVLVCKCGGLNPVPNIVESQPVSEQLIAIQADISRLLNEFEWKPKYPIEDTLKEILNERHI